MKNADAKLQALHSISIVMRNLNFPDSITLSKNDDCPVPPGYQKRTKNGFHLALIWVGAGMEAPWFFRRKCEGFLEVFGQRICFGLLRTNASRPGQCSVDCQIPPSSLFYPSIFHLRWPSESLLSHIPGPLASSSRPTNRAVSLIFASDLIFAVKFDLHNITLNPVLWNHPSPVYLVEQWDWSSHLAINDKWCFIISLLRTNNLPACMQRQVTIYKFPQHYQVKCSADNSVR